MYAYVYEKNQESTINESSLKYILDKTPIIKKSYFYTSVTN